MEVTSPDRFEAKRLELQKLLEELLGSRNVYFQPPSTIKMQYPCIRYGIDRFAEHRADNILYHDRTGYEVTYIDPYPNLVVPDKIHRLPLCRFVRPYVADNLNHYAYLLYF